MKRNLQLKLVVCLGCLSLNLSFLQIGHGFQRDRALNRKIRSFNMLSNPFEHDILEGSLPSFIQTSFLSGEETVGFSNLSFYFTLFLYIISLPGLFSLVTRSVKPSPTQRIYDLPGPANPTAKSTRQIAGEVLAYFKALNYEADAGKEVISFRGVLGKSRAQAAFLTFCTLLGLASLGLVLSVLFPDLGVKAYLITLASPYAGIYYWNNAQRIDEVKVKLETSDDEQITTIIAQGEKEDLERFSRALNLPERGKVYVRGIFEVGDEKKEDMKSYMVIPPPAKNKSLTTSEYSQNKSLELNPIESREEKS